MPHTDFRLYKNERYKYDSKDKEAEEFQDHVKRVLRMQQTIAAQHGAGNPRRVFHAKSHGCLKGKLTLLDNRPEQTRYGLFGSNGKSSYNVLARFSSGVGHDQHDLKFDVKGLALKIFGVMDGEPRQPQTVDWLMTNSPNPFGRDQEEFVQFGEVNVDKGFLRKNLLGFLLRHRRVFSLLSKAAWPICSLVRQQYWSGHAYLLGQHQAMKFNVRPTSTARWGRPAGGSIFQRDYLWKDLLARVTKGPLRFIFSIQLEKDPPSTPIEDSLIEWTEEVSPSIPVAELVLAQQSEVYDCSKLRFTPGRYIPDHRPLGNMGRGRIFTYAASQDGRHAPADDPEERVIFGA